MQVKLLVHSERNVPRIRHYPRQVVQLLDLVCTQSEVVVRDWALDKAQRKPRAPRALYNLSLQH